MTSRTRRLAFATLHQISEFLERIVGIIQPCPMCGERGQWFAFGGWMSQLAGDLRGKRRRLCKWCGWYVDADGFAWACLYKGAPAWAIKSDLKEEEHKKTAYIPWEIYEKAMEAHK